MQEYCGNTMGACMGKVIMCQVAVCFGEIQETTTPGGGP